MLLIIIRNERAKIEYAQACGVSFLFAPRVPPETLQQARSYRGDEINAFPVQLGEAIIGVRDGVEGFYLSGNLKWRKNIDDSCKGRSGGKPFHRN